MSQNTLPDLKALIARLDKGPVPSSEELLEVLEDVTTLAAFKKLDNAHRDLFVQAKAAIESGEPADTLSLRMVYRALTGTTQKPFVEKLADMGVTSVGAPVEVAPPTPAVSVRKADKPVATAEKQLEVVQDRLYDAPENGASDDNILESMKAWANKQPLATFEVPVTMSVNGKAAPNGQEDIGLKAQSGKIILESYAADDAISTKRFIDALDEAIDIQQDRTDSQLVAIAAELIEKTPGVSGEILGALYELAEKLAEREEKEQVITSLHRDALLEVEEYVVKWVDNKERLSPPPQFVMDWLVLNK